MTGDIRVGRNVCIATTSLFVASQDIVGDSADLAVNMTVACEASSSPAQTLTDFQDALTPQYLKSTSTPVPAEPQEGNQSTSRCGCLEDLSEDELHGPILYPWFVSSF